MIPRREGLVDVAEDDGELDGVEVALEAVDEVLGDLSLDDHPDAERGAEG